MRSSSRSWTSGFSLFEMLVVVSTLGIIMLFALPKMTRVLNGSSVKGARNHVVNKYNLARATARQSGRKARFHQDGDLVWITRTPRMLSDGGGVQDTVGGVQSVFALFGVTMTGVPSPLEIDIDPRGLTWDGPGEIGRIRLGKGGVRDSVVFSGYGGVSR